MADTRIPVKKLTDSDGYYYPLSTLESVLNDEIITVKNSVGGYKPNDTIALKTTLKAILSKLFATPSTEVDSLLHLSNIDVSNFSQLATRIPASSLVAEKFNNIVKVIDTKSETNYWYRLYSDNWIEQGGKSTCSTAATSLTIPLTKKMSNSNYSVQITQTDVTGSDTIVNFKESHNQDQIIVKWNTSYTPTFNWKCVGYAFTETE